MARTDRKAKWCGMNWISQHKRLAIYLRDGLACVYCNQGIEAGVQLTLDHVKPHVKGGSNHQNNLVTACHCCNSARQDRSVKSFAQAVAQYRQDISADDIVKAIKAIKAQVKRDLPIAEAKVIVARRGSCAKAIEMGGK